MNLIVTFVMKMMGLGKAVEALDGAPSKAYAAGVGKILTGLAGILGGLAMVCAAFVDAHGAGSYYALLQEAVKGPAGAAIGAGWLLILGGWGDIGQRHAIAKTAIEAAAPEAPKA